MFDAAITPRPILRAGGVRCSLDTRRSMSTILLPTVRLLLLRLLATLVYLPLGN